MTNRIVTFSPIARQKLIEGVNILADAVGVTLGPRGRNVVIDTYGEPSVTKDGVTVAREIRLDDKIESLGANIIKQAASKTATRAGDGTTTATVVAQTLINSGAELIEAGYSPIDIKREYEKYLQQALMLIHDQSSPITMENVKQIATISANNDEAIGDMIYKGFEHVGMEGMVSVEDSGTSESYVTTINGTQIKSGWASPYLVTEEAKAEAVYENPLILITDKKIRGHQELVPAIEVALSQNKPLVILSNEMDAQALGFLIVNKIQRGLRVVAVNPPAYGERRAEIIKDLAILTGADLISESKADRLEKVTLSQLGSCDKIVVGADNTLFINPLGDPNAIQSRINDIREQLSKPDTSEQAEWITQKLTERLGNLTGKVAMFYVGAATQTELKEKKDRVDDALRATKSAIELGYVMGGGLCLYHAALNLGTINTEKSNPKTAFIDALNAPYKKILSNANIEIVNPVNEKTAINSLTGETVNFEKAGIIDPTLVVTEALTNAVSAANMVLLSEVTVHDIEAKYSPPSLDQYK